MPTTVTKTIGTGGDYSTPNAWIAACPANLVTADQVWQGQLKKQEFTAADKVLYITGITTDATRRIEVLTDTGAAWYEDSSPVARYDATKGAALRSTSSGYLSAATLRIADAIDVYIKGLQFSADITNSGAAAWFEGGDKVIVEACIFKAKGLNKSAIQSEKALRFYNCLVYVTGSDGSKAVVVFFGSGSYINNVFAYTGATAPAAGIDGSSLPTIKNNYLCGTAATANLSGATYTTNKAQASSGLPSGVTNAAFSTSTGAKFTNITAGSEDFTIQAGSALIDAGTVDGTVTTDAKGTSRGSSPDIGFWELVVAPTLTSASTSAITSTTATLGATTDSASGTLYVVVTTSATQPSVAQIKAGQDHTGSAAVFANNQAISSSGAKTASATGLTASTTYYHHWVHNNTGGDSNRLSSASFTTSAAGGGKPVFNYLGRNNGNF